MKITIDVAGRYMARVDRPPVDIRAIVIRNYYTVALCFNCRYREAVALQQQSSLIAEQLSDKIAGMYALTGEIFVSTLVAPRSATLCSSCWFSFTTSCDCISS